jgi:DNA-binding transcriptional regulator YbjK
MNNFNSTALFASILSIVIMILASFVGVQYNYVSIENQQLRQRVDSLTAQCYKKDTTIDEATSIALSLSDRMGRLYEMYPETHKKLFSEAD